MQKPGHTDSSTEWQKAGGHLISFTRHNTRRCMVTYLLRLVIIIQLTISIMHRQEEQRIVGETMLPCILMQMVEAAALQVC